MQTLQSWDAEARKLLAGKKIVDAFYDSSQDDSSQGETKLIIALEDGTYLTPMSDGSILWFSKDSNYGILPVLE